MKTFPICLKSENTANYGRRGFSSSRKQRSMWVFDFHTYPCTNSRSWGCNSLSLRVSILLEIASIECIETVIWVSSSLMAALVLSAQEGSSPFTSRFLSCLHFFSYAIRTRSPDCCRRKLPQ